MIDLVGYSALLLNLGSMAMRDLLRLRVLSAIANTIYIVYGLLIDAPPFIIGCSIAVCIHLYHLRKITKFSSSQPTHHE